MAAAGRRNRMMDRTRFYGWKLLAVLWLILVINMAFPSYGAGLMNTYMATELHFSRSALGFFFALFQWMGVLGPLVAVCVNRKGVRFTATVGCLLIAVGAFLMSSFVRSQWQVEVAFGIVVGLGVITGGMVTTQAGVGRWFEKRKALAISLLLTGPYIGGFIAPPLLNWVIVKSGGNWRAGWGLISGLGLLAAIMAILLVKERPSDLGQFPDGESPVMPPKVPVGTGAQIKRAGVYRTVEEWSIPEVLGSPTIWLMIFAALGFSAALTIFLGHGAAHALDLGYSAAEAAFAYSILAVASLAGTLIVAALGDRVEPRFLWAVASCAVGLSLALAMNVTSLVELYLCVFFLGAGLGTCIPCLMTLPANYFGHKSYASVLGSGSGYCWFHRGGAVRGTDQGAGL